MENKNSVLKGVVVFSAGLVIGSVLAVLFAPKSGKETREQIKELTVETKDKINDFIKKGEELFSKK
ncbi:MAG: hypothetical protein A2231_11265 [Candidatus Firestonebacteria bacterium RIFOXYA2_FULL_40_8]|nr:MAG: hypothetical protein A2231_11265 [Candidatus Firestonebacteria bacterium RIFOXYA2_FULL_40_8]